MNALEALGALTIALATFGGVALHRAHRIADGFSVPALAVFGVGAAVASWQAGPLPLSSVIILACVAASAASDIASGFIYDRVVLLGFVAVITSSMLSGTLPQSFVGAAASTLLSASIYLGSSRRGLGFGDVKLLALVGAGIGATAAVVVIGGAFVLGACVALAALMTRRLKLTDRIAFAPYIALATIGAVGLRVAR